MKSSSQNISLIFTQNEWQEDCEKNLPELVLNIIIKWGKDGAFMVSTIQICSCQSPINKYDVYGKTTENFRKITDSVVNM